jgi:hypothetical protein
VLVADTKIDKKYLAFLERLNSDKKTLLRVLRVRFGSRSESVPNLENLNLYVYIECLPWIQEYGNYYMLRDMRRKNLD